MCVFGVSTLEEEVRETNHNRGDGGFHVATRGREVVVM